MGSMCCKGYERIVENMKNITICDNTVTIKSTLKDADMDSVSALVDEILNK